MHECKQMSVRLNHVRRVENCRLTPYRTVGLRKLFWAGSPRNLIGDSRLTAPHSRAPAPLFTQRVGRLQHHEEIGRWKTSRRKISRIPFSTPRVKTKSRSRFICSAG